MHSCSRTFPRRIPRTISGTIPRSRASRLLLAGLCAALAGSWLPAQTAVAQAQVPQASVRSVKVLGSKDSVEIEVQASDRIVPETQVLTGPDRLVVDFPNAVPSTQLRSQSVNRGEVKDLRVGLFQSKPPVTRVVIDLNSAQSYQIFPYGRTVIIKVTGGGADAAESAGNLPSGNLASAAVKRPGLVVANYTRAEPARVVTADQPLLEVTYRNGLLGIRANKATLSEVLFAVQQRTGAQVSIAAGAEQEKVVADIEPGPAPEVLARLLNGSKFNFLILSAVNDPRQVDRVILSVRPEGFVAPPLTPVQERAQNGVQGGVQNDDPEDRDTATVPPPNGALASPVPPQAGAQGEGKPPGDESTPNQ
jgi:AMIN domain-containing protein